MYGSRFQVAIITPSFYVEKGRLQILGKKQFDLLLGKNAWLCQSKMLLFQNRFNVDIFTDYLTTLLLLKKWCSVRTLKLGGVGA